MLARGAVLPVAISFIPSLVVLFLSNLVFFPLIYLSGVLLILPLFVLIFFRDPDREIGKGLVSPADGKVVYTDEKSFDIFMSVTDVHVNRTPAAGKIVETKSISGGYAPAYSEESKKNNRREITIKTSKGKVKVTQIVGIFARRIVPYVKEGDDVERGQKIGMIRFGSRVRVEFPSPEKVDITVSVGDKVKAGETAVGVWR
ncbi:MAG: phosphatidylserine decarboxylase [Thermoplasmata archaeon]